MMRGTGVLLPIASLPTKYGIGGFSKEAYDFVDWLKEAGVDYWQILPLGPTGYGDSPYQSISTFAGNPYFIDLEALKEEGLLNEEELKAADCGKNERYIDYGAIYNTRLALLKKAFKRSHHARTKKFKEFCEANAYWLEDYALFVSIKNSLGGVCWTSWDKDIKTRKPEAIKKYSEKFKEEIAFYKFNQFMFSQQWGRLKEYANKNGIRIIGDIPIYVAFDSADAWANTHLFEFDRNCNPKAVAGCPPDAFCATGQLWGNPLYNWKVHKEDGFGWWISRISHCYELYDVVRVDHFRGFDEYYSIPAKDETAEHGVWKKGPGIELFKAIKKKLGEKDIIAEDLGFLTPSVVKLLKNSGFPGMKVLQFAFDPHTPSIYLPHNHIENCVVYTGTHDNDTTRGWFRNLNHEEKQYIGEYLGCGSVKEEDIAWIFIRAALRSPAKLAVIPMQDILNCGSEARLNAPSTFGENWKWRMLKDEATHKLSEKLARCNWMYERHKF